MKVRVLKLPAQTNRLDAGFTLVELMVTIVVLGVIVSLAAPNISTQLANQRVKSTTATLISVLQEAKAESSIRRVPVRVSYSNGNKPSNRINIDVPYSGPSPLLSLSTTKDWTDFFFKSAVARDSIPGNSGGGNSGGGNSGGGNSGGGNSGGGNSGGGNSGGGNSGGGNSGGGNSGGGNSGGGNSGGGDSGGGNSGGGNSGGGNSGGGDSGGGNSGGGNSGGGNSGGGNSGGGNSGGGDSGGGNSGGGNSGGGDSGGSNSGGGNSGGGNSGGGNSGGGNSGGGNSGGGNSGGGNSGGGNSGGGNSGGGNSGGGSQNINFVSIETHKYNAKTIIKSDPLTVTFQPHKHVDAAISYTICDENKSASPRKITVSKSGIISSQKGGVCTSE